MANQEKNKTPKTATLQDDKECQKKKKRGKIKILLPLIHSIDYLFLFSSNR